MAKRQTVQVTSIIRKLFVEHNGKLVEVKEIDNLDIYGPDVTIYAKEAVKGATKGKLIHAVAVADYKRAPRASTKQTVEQMLASGMTAEEIVAKLAGK